MASRIDKREVQREVLACLRTRGVLYELEEPETTIGRSDECDLVLDGQSISQVHARLLLGETQQLRDLGSSNGTFVNGLRLSPQQPYTLSHGDVLQFAFEKTSYTFEVPQHFDQERSAMSPGQDSRNTPRSHLQAGAMHNCSRELTSNIPQHSREEISTVPAFARSAPSHAHRVSQLNQSTVSESAWHSRDRAMADVPSELSVVLSARDVEPRAVTRRSNLQDTTPGKRNSPDAGDAVTIARCALALQRVSMSLSNVAPKLQQLCGATIEGSAANGTRELVDFRSSMPLLEELDAVCNQLREHTNTGRSSVQHLRAALANRRHLQFSANTGQSAQELEAQLSSLRQRRAELEHRRSDLERRPASEDLEEEAIDGIMAELRRHLSLYGTVFGSQESSVEAGGSRPDGSVWSLISEANKQQSLNSVASLASAPRGETLDSASEPSVVLQALLTSQQRIARLERRREASNRRWQALGQELESRKEEAPHWQRWVRELRSRPVEATGGTELPGLGAEDSAARLLQELERLELSKATLQTRLQSASDRSALAQRRCHEAERRAGTLAKLHGASEELADRVAEARHRAAPTRAETLRQANAALARLIPT